jgi:hypothetical protein
VARKVATEFGKCVLLKLLATSAILFVNTKTNQVLKTWLFKSQGVLDFQFFGGIFQDLVAPEVNIENIVDTQ